VLDGLTQRTSGTFTATNITVSYDSATEKLMLSGLRHDRELQRGDGCARLLRDGRQSDQFWNNTTRTMDGERRSQNVPAGQGQNTSTTTITVDAVDTAPVNHLPVSNPGGNEDTTFRDPPVSRSRMPMPIRRRSR